MPSKKPTATPRRARRTDTAKPAELTREQQREIDRRARERERDPTADKETAKQGRGIVEMKGRLVNGERKGATVKRRTTLYLPLPIADELDARARRGRVSLSDAAAEALSEQWAIDLESAS